MICLITSLIRMYQKFISPLFPRTCRYAPSCSQYAFEAFTEHGIIKGCVLSVWRILRCNPFFEGGYDPVPSKCHVIRKNEIAQGDIHE